MCDSSRCFSERIAFINGKTSDMCQFMYKEIDKGGYVPDLVISEDGDEDYINFNFCLDCGKIQGKFPISDEQVEKAIERM